MTMNANSNISVIQQFSHEKKIQINNLGKINLTAVNKFCDAHWIKPSNLPELCKLFAYVDSLLYFMINFENWLHGKK